MLRLSPSAKTEHVQRLGHGGKGEAWDGLEVVVRNVIERGQS
jgi:hypothetical protein